MAKLSEPARRYIVQRLACYDTPSEIAAGVKEEFGLIVTRQSVHSYHPDHGQPAKKWRAIFTAARKGFEDGITTEPASRREVRVRRLARMAERAEERKNYQLAAALYEQIAKEVGDAYTNRRKLEHSGEVKTGPSLDDLSDEELAALAARLAAEQRAEAPA